MITNPSSSQTYSSATASSARDPQQAFNEDPPPSPIPPTPVAEAKSTIVRDLVILLIGMAFTGVLGYFSAVFALKDDISNNSSSIDVLKNEYKHFGNNLKELQKENDAVNDIKSDVSAIKAKIEDMQYMIRNQTQSSKSKKRH